MKRGRVRNLVPGGERIFQRIYRDSAAKGVLHISWWNIIHTRI